MRNNKNSTKILKIGESTLCIDAGYIHNGYLEHEFERVGIDPASITHLFLTHTDMDHAGSIDKDSRARWGQNAKVFMSRDEVRMIDGSTPRRFIFRNPVQISRDYRLLDDGDVIEIGAATVQAIATPGHTPGHIVQSRPEDTPISRDGDGSEDTIQEII